jgi:hypothetical protein
MEHTAALGLGIAVGLIALVLLIVWLRKKQARIREQGQSKMSNVLPIPNNPTTESSAKPDIDWDLELDNCRVPSTYTELESELAKLSRSPATEKLVVNTETPPLVREKQPPIEVGTPTSELWRFFDLTADYLRDEKWHHCRKSGVESGAKKGKESQEVMFNDAVQVFYTYDSVLGKDFRKNEKSYTPLTVEEDETLGALHQRRKINQEHRRQAALERQAVLEQEQAVNPTPIHPTPIQLAIDHVGGAGAAAEHSPSVVSYGRLSGKKVSSPNVYSSAVHQGTPERNWYREQWDDSEWTSAPVDPFKEISSMQVESAEKAAAIRIIQARIKGWKTRQGEGGYSGEIYETETGESYEVVDPFGHVGAEVGSSDVGAAIEADEFELMNEAELRQYLEGLHVHHDGCVTKHQLIQELHRVLQEEQSEREANCRAVSPPVSLGDLSSSMDSCGHINDYSDDSSSDIDRSWISGGSINSDGSIRHTIDM